MGINLILSLTLIWPLGERGLAVSTAVAASVQAILLTVVFSRAGSPLAWGGLASTMLRGTVATLAMTAAVMIVEWGLFGPETSRAQQAVEVMVAILTGVVVYLVVAWLLGMRELALLIGRSRVGS
jgi:peptidoglycan biosynthesis protein MviN/MurJ (putative lipid II flippase)